MKVTFGLPFLTGQVAASTFYDPVVDFIGAAGDLSSYQSNYDDGAIPVILTFVSS